MALNLDKLWDVLINKAHVAIVVGCQAIILLMHWRYGKDISVNVQSTINWFYAFMAGHFGASQAWPDKKDVPQ